MTDIIVVEDNIEMAGLLCDFISAEGYTTAHFTSGEEALSFFEKEGARLRVCCSKGTYIRSLCEDIGRKTGYLAHMTSLIRTRCGPYSIKQSLKLSEVEAKVKAGEKDYIEDLSSLFSDLPVFRVSKEEDLMLMNGNYLMQLN